MIRLRKQYRLADKLCLLLAILVLSLAPAALAQAAGSLRGEVLDAGGAVVPGAIVKLTHGSNIYTAGSTSDGSYVFNTVPAGTYTLTVDAPEFAPFSKADVHIDAEKTQRLNIALTVAVQQQAVTVTNENRGVSVNPDENASATSIKGTDLDALSDDPTQLQSELQALAGPDAGPDGGEIYIDGFSGGQLPPKSSIREIRVNQNPFSAEYDRMGYGRIEILTKPGSDKFKGQFSVQGMDSGLNTANPLVQNQPPYYAYYNWANVNGPISKTASYFADGGYQTRQNQNIVNAINPDGTPLSYAVANPLSSYWIDGRVDLQLGKSNTLTIRGSYNPFTGHNSSVGGLNLRAQGLDRQFNEFDLQMGDTVVVNQHLINETRFQWRRVRSIQVAQNSTPAVVVQGAFVDGGNSVGKLIDHQDNFEFQNYSTATAGKHTIRFGLRLRTYRDANFSIAGKNATYIYQSLAHYNAHTPDQYLVTAINDSRARVALYDGGLFYQDDWRIQPNLTLSYGLRFETQDGIHDHGDWAPRFAIAWAPARAGQTTRPTTVLHAGFGLFYDRFNVPSNFNGYGSGGLPYLIQTIHQNGVNMQNYVVNDPTFNDPTKTVEPGDFGGANASVPVIYTLDPKLRAPVNMQGGIGVDHQFGKHLTANATYLYTHGEYQVFSNNVTAPSFDPATYTVTGATPAVYNYQYQSNGFYTKHRLILSSSVHSKNFSLNANYAYLDYRSDSPSIGSFPSVAGDPGLDYGRATYDIHNSFFLLGSYSAPYGIVIAPLLNAQSGTPYNITIGDDLTKNNQFNARPTYGTCGATDVVSTQFGCLDTNPVGKGETIIPFDLGTGPANVVMHLRVSKVFGIGPRTKSATGGNQFNGGNNNSGGLGASQQQIKLDATAPRRFSLTMSAAALNLFNIVNRGTPNGVLSPSFLNGFLSPSSLFGKSQTLAGGNFGVPVPGNRVIFVQAMFSF